jgi:hypothetical protein
MSRKRNSFVLNNSNDDIKNVSGATVTMTRLTASRRRCVGPASGPAAVTTTAAGTTAAGSGSGSGSGSSASTMTVTDNVLSSAADTFTNAATVTATAATAAAAAAAGVTVIDTSTLKSQLIQCAPAQLTTLIQLYNKDCHPNMRLQIVSQTTATATATADTRASPPDSVLPYPSDSSSPSPSDPSPSPSDPSAKSQEDEATYTVSVNDNNNDSDNSNCFTYLMMRRYIDKLQVANSSEGRRIRLSDEKLHIDWRTKVPDNDNDKDNTGTGTGTWKIIGHGNPKRLQVKSGHCPVCNAHVRRYCSKCDNFLCVRLPKHATLMYQVNNVRHVANTSCWQHWHQAQDVVRRFRAQGTPEKSSSRDPVQRNHDRALFQAAPMADND